MIFGKVRKLVILLFVISIFLVNAAAVAQIDEQEKYGDKLWYSELNMPLSLNPLYGLDEKISNRIIGFMYDGLIKINSDMEIINALALEVQDPEWLVSGRESITVKLRPDVKFHDGSFMTAEDVKFTYDAMMDPQTFTSLKANLHNLDRVNIVDENTVTFIFKTRNPSNIYLLRYPIMAAHEYNHNTAIELESMRDQVITPRSNYLGTGPYSLMVSSPQMVMFNSFRDYFDGHPYINDIMLQIRADQETMLQEIETQALDFLPTIPPYAKVRLDLNPDIVLVEYRTLNYTSLVINCKHKFLSNVEVRKAIDFAIDKQHIINSVFNGLAERISGPYSPLSWAYNPIVQPREHNFEKARAIMIEQGFSDSDDNKFFEKDGSEFIIKILCERGSSIHNQVLSIVTESLKEIGINANVEYLDKATLHQRTQYKHDYDMVILSWDFGVDPDRYDLFHSSQNMKGGNNFANYANEEVDALLADGRSISNRDVRKMTYHEVHQIIGDEVPHIFLYTNRYSAPLHYRIKDADINAINVFSNIKDWWCSPKIR